MIPRLSRRQLLQYGTFAIGSSVITACAGNSADPQAEKTPDGLDKVTMVTDWLAQAEHGGFYQALAAGIYEKYGLSVTLRMGGPQVSGSQLLLGGVADFAMSNSTQAINAVAQKAPIVTVAAMFQKDPRCIIAHPNTTVEDLGDLKDRPIFVTQASVNDFWGLLSNRYGFTDKQRRVYNFNPAPFLADNTSSQQGYITSEPFTLSQELGEKPVVFLLADYGYSPYATTIDTTRAVIDKKPDVVKRFVQASSEGWQSYLKDPTPANKLIRKDHPEMPEDLLDYGVSTLKEYGIVRSGDAEANGIGYMTADRWKGFFDSMVEWGVYDTDVPYESAFVLDFVQDLPTAG
ncbi:MAG: ABC transporter substrate-binding protein [Cyanobacteria bacterium P01_D01_bin.73]